MIPTPAFVRQMTPAEFETYALREENVDVVLEFLGGEIHVMPSNPYASQVSMLIAYHILGYVMKNPIAHVTGEAGGYRIGTDRYAPDVAVTLKSKQETLALEGYNPVPPDLAVEVEFPTNIKSQRRLEKKLKQYHAQGTVVWVAYPETREIEIHAPNQSVRVLGASDTIDGGEILPGFSMVIKDVFPLEFPDDEDGDGK